MLLSLVCQNPDYHGFSSDAEVDKWNMRIGFFFGISLALVIGGTFIHYLPDHGWVPSLFQVVVDAINCTMEKYLETMVAPKNWIFDYKSQKSPSVWDENSCWKMILYLRNSDIVSECLTCVCVCVTCSMRQWARREAECVILQREKEELPLIEENYYDPNKILQPTAEES